jgi:hypothetical protein
VFLRTLYHGTDGEFADAIESRNHFNLVTATNIALPHRVKMISRVLDLALARGARNTMEALSFITRKEETLIINASYFLVMGGSGLSLSDHITLFLISPEAVKSKLPGLSSGLEDAYIGVGS